MNSGLSVRVKQVAPFAMDVTFDAPAGQVTALFGPSGSGKTTLLRVIAGLHRADEVSIACDGETWTDDARGAYVPSHRRPVGFLFQDYALFPHLTIAEQLAMTLAHRPAAGRAARVAELISMMRLDGLGDRRPAALSGGQQQRAALARALARDPRVLLLDEPFAAVDWALRESLRHELVTLQRSLALTTLLVTHDFEDVAKLASHLVVLDRGAVAAAGTVQDLTSRNAVPGVVSRRDPSVALDAEVLEHDTARQLTRLIAGDMRLEVPTVDAAAGTTVRIQIAARDVILASRPPEGLSLHNVLQAKVVAVEAATLAALRLIHLEIGAIRLLSLVTSDAARKLALTPGTPVLALVKAVAVEAFA